MKPKLSKPPSRIGKKQIIGYVTPDLAEAVRKYVIKHDKTNQEIVADAINAFLASYNRRALLDTGHTRIVRRKKGVSQARKVAAICRQGKKAIGGWFDEEQVLEVHSFSKEIGLSVQKILEAGLKHITGLEPFPVK